MNPSISQLLPTCGRVSTNSRGVAAVLQNGGGLRIANLVIATTYEKWGVAKSVALEGGIQQKTRH